MTGMTRSSRPQTGFAQTGRASLNSTHYANRRTEGGYIMAAGAAAAAAAIANAIKASGVVVRVSPGDFNAIVLKVERPLVIYAEGGLFSTNYQYLISLSLIHI